MRPGERGWGLLCTAHVANWLVSCHLVFLQIGKLSFSAGALELLSLLSRLLQIIGFAHREIAVWFLRFALFTFCAVYLQRVVDVRRAECGRGLFREQV